MCDTIKYLLILLYQVIFLYCIFITLSTVSFDNVEIFLLLFIMFYLFIQS